MHSDFRELKTKYVRSVKDLEIATDLNKKYAKELAEKDDLNTELSKELVSQKTQISNSIEKIASLNRELDIKAN
jgi:hypothetical protein